MMMLMIIITIIIIIIVIIIITIIDIIIIIIIIIIIMILQYIMYGTIVMCLDLSMPPWYHGTNYMYPLDHLQPPCWFNSWR